LKTQSWGQWEWPLIVSSPERAVLELLDEVPQRETFHQADVLMEGLRRDAGVGPGALYRHFPTREELLEAVCRTEMEKLASAKQKFTEELPPIEALRAWLLLFVDYIVAKQLIATALNALLGDPKKVFEASKVVGKVA
jgi:hypothetical protein